MRSVILTASLLLCFLDRSLVSGLKIRSVEAQPGEDVKLLCSNFSTIPVRITWFRVTNTSHLYDIASMFESQKDMKNGEGFPKEKFVMSSNMSVVFLTIKTVNVSDSGLYFCGYYISRSPVITEATHLEVHGFSTLKYLPVGILSAVTVLLMMAIIYLVVKMKRLQKGRGESSPNPHHQGRGEDDLDYAALTIRPKTENDSSPSPDRDTDLSVIYSAPRRAQEAPEASNLMRN
ncbi:uncharacterized protein LOC115385858 [Salarias fasciatus]|uniref:Uncharacterized LOC115385858 n=1 Tax=Salarias fasciatus TaxID=181472 RepID=A0A672IFF3_SALFA|nr:uncharacterized protein LOC115385858 [Salarias fasciatus]